MQGTTPLPSPIDAVACAAASIGVTQTLKCVFTALLHANLFKHSNRRNSNICLCICHPAFAPLSPPCKTLTPNRILRMGSTLPLKTQANTAAFHLPELLLLQYKPLPLISAQPTKLPPLPFVPPPGNCISSIAMYSTPAITPPTRGAKPGIHA